MLPRSPNGPDTPVTSSSSRHLTEPYWRPPAEGRRRWASAGGPAPTARQGRIGRPQDKVAALAAGPGRHPGQDLDPGRVDQDHAPQVEHDVVVALADQVVQVLPQLEGRVRVDVAAHGDDGLAVGGVAADCNSGAVAASLLGSGWPATTGLPLLRTALPEIAPTLRLLGGDRSHVGGLGPFWPWVMSNSTVCPSSSEPPSWMALAWTKTSLPDSGWMKP